MFIFVLNGFINDLWSSKAFDTRGILSTASDIHHWFMNGWKQMAQRLKLQERLLTINKRNIIRWNIYRDNNFHSRRQGLKCLCLLKCPESSSLKLYIRLRFKLASRRLLFSKMNSRQENCSRLSFTGRIITK